MANNDSTIEEYFELPSKGKIYRQKVNPLVHLRSMTVMEEMKRLGNSQYPYKQLCDIIDDCIVEPIGISSYDMHIGDFYFLLFKLRIVTYGSEYPASSNCPYCRKKNFYKTDLDTLPVIEYTDEYSKLYELKLPQTGRNLTMRYQTPRDMDEIAKEAGEFKKTNEDSTLNIEYLLEMEHGITMVDGKKVGQQSLDIWLRALPMEDANVIKNRQQKLNGGIGLQAITTATCTNPKCGATYPTMFQLNDEFFGPKID